MMKYLLPPLLATLLTCHCYASEPLSPADYVNPFIGTSNFGATHPGAQFPHALTSLSPFNVAYQHPQLNKFEKDEAWNSRVYVHENKFLTGFSHVNLSGVGCPDLGVILAMPTTGKLQLDAEHYGSTYSNEEASAGYYQSRLDKYNTRVELTSTLRTGLSRYTFPAGESHVLLNLGLGLSNETGGSLRIVSTTEVEGSRTIGSFCYSSQDSRPVYFVARFDKAAARFGAFKKMPKYKGVEADWVKYNDSIKPYPGYRQQLSGDEIGAYFSFDTKENEVIQLKVGISYVSIANARENLLAEQPDFNFEQTKQKSRQAWNSLLDRVQLAGAEADKSIFYTALYHALIHPSIINDVNGDYPLMSSLDHQNSGGIGNSKDKNRYSVYSLWDTSRNIHPLLSLLYPEIQSAMVESVIQMYKESGWLPKWELLSMETQVMVGDPATAMLADTYLRGIRDFDIDTAYEAMLKSANTALDNPIRPENADYLSLGYVPVDDEGPYDGSVSTSLEYYVADFALGSLAQTLNKTADAQTFIARSQGYRKLFDSQSGMLRPKRRDGSWLSPYDPELGRNFEPAPGYIEGNAWNYRFYVPFDIPGLMQLLGGQDNFLLALETTFNTHNFDMGNEPDITYPYLFNYIEDAHHQSQIKVHQLIKQHFTTQASGLPGNDDAGTMSAWLVFSMLGLYPLSPGLMDYALTTPSFDKITVKLNNHYYPGKSLTIYNKTADETIQQPSFNDQTLQEYFISHQVLTRGGELYLPARGRGPDQLVQAH